MTEKRITGTTIVCEKLIALVPIYPKVYTSNTGQTLRFTLPVQYKDKKLTVIVEENEKKVKP